MEEEGQDRGRMGGGERTECEREEEGEVKTGRRRSGQSLSHSVTQYLRINASTLVPSTSTGLTHLYLSV